MKDFALAFGYGALRMTPDSGQEKDKPDPAKDPELPPGTEAIVQCEGFSCLARINEKGEWASLRGKPLKVVRVVKVL